MSYILDALRRAESERERGSVPGLHSQTVPPTTPDPAPRSPLPPWVAAGVGGAIVLVGVAAWFWLRPGDAPAPVQVQVQVDRAPIAAKLATPPLAPKASMDSTRAPFPAPVPTTPVPATAAAPATIPAAAPAPPAPPRPAPTAEPTPPAPPAPGTATATAPSNPPATRPATALPGPALASAPAAAPQPRAEARVINFEQLPEDVRRAIPPLVIGGAIYSDNAASRMLIVGGQLLHEGDSAGPGLTLEQIKPRSAVLRWKQLRYEVTF